MERLLDFDVSRETTARLAEFEAAVRKWSPRINLVSRADLDRLSARHTRDSAQLWRLGQRPDGHWLDLGSGGGFPGLVIAILAAELSPALRLTLVESDQRKCAFLRSVARELELEPEIRAQRSEDLPPLGADVITARALAPLDQLLAHHHRHAVPGAVGFYPKGRRYHAEIEVARNNWRFQCAAISSITDPEAAILKIEEVERG